MKKDFLDELMEELQKLKDEQKKITISAPVAPHKVINVIGSVARKHEMTFEEKRAISEIIMSWDGITPEEAEVLRDLDATRKDED